MTVSSSTQMTFAGAGVAAWDGTVQPLIVTIGMASSSPASVSVGTSNPVVSWAAASRFLEQATFGPRYRDIVQVQALGFNNWLLEQFRAAQNPPYGTQDLGEYSYYPARFFYNAVNASDQLRQRVAFALTQLFVVSTNTLGVPEDVAPYYNMLYNLAFTNYPTLLAAVTTSPAMGTYLNMAGNAKASGGPTGTSPNQNYAREVLQLFSIGTVLLDNTGTPLTNNGVPIQAYSQDTVGNFSRVFTGWNLNNGSFTTPMVGSNVTHDTDITINPKTLLSVPGGPTLPYQTTTNGDVTIELGQALANISAHPNVAPFISKFLIQHLVTSNPSPAYVSRVARLFSLSNGDMKTVLMAILLDSEARAGDTSPDANLSFGHLREPALWLSGICRALNMVVPDELNSLPPLSGDLGQPLFYPPSVFNFYTPTYPMPTSLGLPSGLVGPEFQLESASTAYVRLYIAATQGFSGSEWIESSSSIYGGWDFSAYINLATQPALLVDAIDATLTHGQMPNTMKTVILSALPNEPNVVAQTSLAIFLTTTSSYYQVIH